MMKWRIVPFSALAVAFQAQPACARTKKKKSGGHPEVKMFSKVFNLGGDGDGQTIDIDMGDVEKMFGGNMQEMLQQALKNSKGARGAA